MNTFDFVIVGAGTAGCILSYRLAEQGHSVCVVEAGPPDNNPYIRVPAGMMKTSVDPRITWQFVHGATPYTLKRDIPFIQGRTLGGSGAVNGMVYSRGQPSDFDNWASLGCTGWDFRSVLPYFQKYENFTGLGDDHFRGRTGLMPVTVLSRRDAISDRFIQGAIETGIPFNPDYNGISQFGVGYAQATIHKGKRWSSAHAYLHPARRRWGVRVLTNATVRRVLMTGRVANGVEYSMGGCDVVKTLHARLGVVLSAGTVNSPKLLQLSGLGSGKHLQALGISTVVDLPGVGANLSDHYAARIVARVHDGIDTINGRSRGLPLIKEIARWLLGQPSILSMSAMAVYAFCKSNADSKENDYALSFTPASLNSSKTLGLDAFPGITSGTWCMRPQSRGFVQIQSMDFRAPPYIQANHLQAEQDRRILITGIKHCRAIFRSAAMRQIIKQQIHPDEACHTDDEWLDYVRRFGTTAYHLVGTCKMGEASDSHTVVDAKLRVRGVERLYVVDASVMPTTPSANTNASTAMIAEKAADMLRFSPARR
ncbi:GMC family oxidoreductase [Ottowia thiooxydans]|uniref:Choline dehydrogenase n=1 Tax=Ottowia thiooxydans TaxID=219182 RepID=A0ABV2QDW4_9BURK